MNVVFLDRDGTIIREPEDEQVDSFEKLEYLPGVFNSLRLLCMRGYELVMVTNQDGLGTENYPKRIFDAIQARLLKTLEGEGITFRDVFVCPHFPSAGCACRKPAVGSVGSYASRNDWSRTGSYIIGDRETDVKLGKALGIRTILLDASKETAADYASDSLSDACMWILRNERGASVERKTSETSIAASVQLEGTGSASVKTGIGFFDHMLAQLAKHSGIDISLTVEGDLNIDEHHTIEDTGLALGEAIREALGDKRGIERYGFAVPMDEARASAAMDLSNRPYLRFNARFKREKIGDMPTETVEDFFRAFADGLRCTLHISADGRNEHHKAEAMFKATARALKQAVTRNFETSDRLPTTKGVL